ncbi:MAG: hypothetical protein GY705_27820, partial [Bacteroidetes bacterium]|nr:hypothetical protein [Bacteroidota bacterium]
MYKAIEVIYTKTEYCIRVNEYVTRWFDTLNGVKQGDNLSPTLFSVYLNDLAEEINCKNYGLKIENIYLNLLLYADDIVLLAESEDKLQKM